MVFGDMGELEHALETKAVTLHAKIKGRFRRSTRRQAGRRSIETTPGRMMIGELAAEERQSLRSRSSTR